MSVLRFAACHHLMAMLAPLSLGLLLSSSISAAAPGMTPGPVEIQSIGPMTFAEDHVLLVGDPKAATVYAIEIEPTAETAAQPQAAYQIENVAQAIAAAAQTEESKVILGDMAADAKSQTVVLSALVGGKVKLFRIQPDGAVSAIQTDKIPHAKKELPNPPADELTGQGRRQRNLRLDSITDLAFFDGKVLVSGASAGEAKSAVREFPFPFGENSLITNVEIFHAAHGRVEDSTIRTFVPMTIEGSPSLLAGFTCTPLVRFPIAKMRGEQKIRGTTVAELGNRNVPLDLIVYEQGDKQYLLMTNSARGVMKISTDQLGDDEGLTQPVRGGGTAGQAFEQVNDWNDIVQMDKFSDSQAVILTGKPDGVQKLSVVDLP